MKTWEGLFTAMVGVCGGLLLSSLHGDKSEGLKRLEELRKKISAGFDQDNMNLLNDRGQIYNDLKRAFEKTEK